MIRGFLIFILLTALASATPFDNLREGKSLYIGEQEVENIQDFYSRNGVVPTHLIFDETIKGKNAFCSSTILSKLEEKFPGEEGKDILLTLRQSQKVDDIAFSILKMSSELTFNTPLPVSHKTTKKLKDSDKIISALKDFARRAKRNECDIENYRSLVNSVKKYAEKFNKRFLKKVNYLGKHEKIISKEQFKNLEKMRQGKVHEWVLTLKSYHEKIRGIRTQFPLPSDTKELSDFVTEKVKKKKLSRRQDLFQKYTYFQIILMADLVKKMRTRLSSNRIEIIIYDEDGKQMEVIGLSPMERFRFILKLLRKEMDTLAHNTFFNGKRPSYSEVIVSAFELGLIPEIELSETANLEEIWNPSKTRWEKIVFWVKTFGGISAVLIPPPYGFVSVLALMALESTVPDDDGRNDEGNLF